MLRRVWFELKLRETLLRLGYSEKKAVVVKVVITISITVIVKIIYAQRPPKLAHLTVTNLIN